MTVIFSGSMFLLGHWVASLPFFVEKSKSAEFKSMAQVIGTIVPNLETLNWRAAPVYGTVIASGVVGHALLYSVAWIVFLLSATALIFRRRDFV